MSRYQRHNPDEPVRHDWLQASEPSSTLTGSNGKPTREAALATSTPKPLPCRLAELVKELNECAATFKRDGNDEAYCATWAAAERIKEVVNEWLMEQRPCDVLPPNS
jgi:hypothetical protein